MAKTRPKPPPVILDPYRVACDAVQSRLEPEWGEARRAKRAWIGTFFLALDMRLKSVAEKLAAERKKVRKLQDRVAALTEELARVRKVKK